MKRLTGAILLLAGAVLFAAERICNTLFFVMMAIMGTIYSPESPIYSKSLIALSVLFFISGLGFMIWDLIFMFRENRRKNKQKYDDKLDMEEEHDEKM